MDKYAKIRELGLGVFRYGPEDEMCISVEALLAVLDKGVEVFGEQNSADGNDRAVSYLDSRKREKCTHSGLLLNYKPIAKPEPVSARDIIEYLDAIEFHFKSRCYGDAENTAKTLRERINKVGLK